MKGSNYLSRDNFEAGNSLDTRKGALMEHTLVESEIRNDQQPAPYMPQQVIQITRLRFAAVICSVQPFSLQCFPVNTTQTHTQTSVFYRQSEDLAYTLSTIHFSPFLLYMLTMILALNLTIIGTCRTIT